MQYGLKRLPKLLSNATVCCNKNPVEPSDWLVQPGFIELCLGFLPHHSNCCCKVHVM